MQRTAPIAAPVLRQRLFDWREILALGLVGAGLFAILAHLEVFETLHAVSRAHEDWQIDEIVIVVPVMAFILAIFSLLRVRQLRREVAARLALQEEVYRAATNNRLTGLPNDQATIAAIGSATAAMPLGTSAALIVMRDSMRWHVERRLGPDGVAEPCRMLIQRMVRALPPGSIIGSLDNDNLLMFAPQLAGAARVEAFLDRLMPVLQAPVTVGPASFMPQPRFGVAMLDPAQADVLTFVQQATRALDQNLQRGGDELIAFYDAGYERTQVERRQMLEQLGVALANGGISFEFQPIIDLDSGAVTTFEALSRWQPDGYAPLSPDVFIGMLDHIGMVDRFTEYALDHALRAAATWPREVGVAINLSHAQLVEPQLSRRVFRAMQTHAIAPGRLEFELSECSDQLQSPTSRHAIAMLRALGVRVVVDDFGAGHSNLNLLHEIEFDRIKLDRKLISRLRTRSKDRAIIEALLTLTTTLRRSLTAEGVEDEETANILRAMGCQRAQGYWFAKPMPEGDTAAFLGARAIRQFRPRAVA